MTNEPGDERSATGGGDGPDGAPGPDGPGDAASGHAPGSIGPYDQGVEETPIPPPPTMVSPVFAGSSTPPPSGNGRGPVMAGERRQRNVVAGLGVAGVLVLLVGVIAFAATRSSNDADGEPIAAPSTSAVVSTTTSTTSTTTTTTSTTTTIPPVAAAEAGGDIEASRGAVVTLDAADIGTGVDSENVRWVQVAGPDVTGGLGALGGRTVSFGAPCAHRR